MINSLYDLRMFLHRIHKLSESQPSGYDSFRVIGQKVCVTNPNKLENL